MQRDFGFIRIGKGIYALTYFLEKVKKEYLGFFSVNDKEDITFQKNAEIKTKVFKTTEKTVSQKVKKEYLEHHRKYIFQ